MYMYVTNDLIYIHVHVHIHAQCTCKLSTCTYTLLHVFYIPLFLGLLLLALLVCCNSCSLLVVGALPLEG